MAKAAKPKKPRGAARNAVPAELLADWVIVSEERLKGATLWVLRSKRHPRSRQWLTIRMSKEDVKGGETVMSQLSSMLGPLASVAFLPGYLVVVTECSGGNAYEDRPDLKRIEKAIAVGACDAVAFRDITRLARARRAFLDFTDLLLATDVSLYLALQGGRIDLGDETQRLTMALLLEVAVMERALTQGRSQDGVWKQRVLCGKGIINHAQIGFRPNGEGWLEQDPETWPWRRAIHLGLKEVKEGTRASYERLTDLLRAAGSTLTLEEVEAILDRKRSSTGLRAFEALLEVAGLTRSHAALAKILQSELPVTGRFYQRLGGIPVEMKPIEIHDAIPPEVHLLNQEILAQSHGSSVRTKLGDFCLDERLTCSVCGGSLGAYFGRNGTVGYHHRGKSGEACRGMIIPLGEVEPAVIRALVRLESDAALRWEWFENGQAVGDEIVKGVAAVDAKLALEAEFHALLAETAPLMAAQAQAQLDALQTGSADGYMRAQQLATFSDQADVIETLDRITQLKRRIEVFDAIVEHRKRQQPRVASFDPKLSAALVKRLTENLPTDFGERVLRKKLVNACLSEVPIGPATDASGAPAWAFTIAGPLGPFNQRPTQPIAPSSAAKEALRLEVQTVKQSYDYLTVRTLVEERGRLGALREMAGKRQRPMSGGGDLPDWVSHPLMTSRGRS